VLRGWWRARRVAHMRGSRQVSGAPPTRRGITSYSVSAAPRMANCHSKMLSSSGALTTSRDVSLLNSFTSWARGERTERRGEKVQLRAGGVSGSCGVRVRYLKDPFDSRVAHVVQPRGRW
jgi:hypothetical protein